MEFPDGTPIEEKEMKFLEIGRRTYETYRSFFETMVYAGDDNPFICKALTLWDTKQNFLEALSIKDPDFNVKKMRNERYVFIAKEKKSNKKKMNLNENLFTGYHEVG